jgi:hypothetical protein
LVSGARYKHQKRNFPPIDVIDIQFEHQGSALVTVDAWCPDDFNLRLFLYLFRVIAGSSITWLRDVG